MSTPLAMNIAIIVLLNGIVLFCARKMKRGTVRILLVLFLILADLLYLYSFPGFR